MKIYTAQAMSGLKKSDVVKKALKDKKFLEAFNITVLSPVIAEGVENTNETLMATKGQMDVFWFRDKQLIREANVIFDMTPGAKSEGVAHELAYARYFLWKPIVRVYPKGKMPPVSSVAYFEDDLIVDNLTDACVEAKRRWGSLVSRFKWRLNMYRKSLVKAIIYKLGEWK